MPHLPKSRRRRYLPDRIRKPTGDQRFYNSQAWRKTSRAVRQRHPLCEVCEAIGVVAVAEVTDHIIAREEGGADYDVRNLMPLCSYHHDRKSGMEGQGIELNNRRTIDGLIPVDRDEILALLARPTSADGGTGGGVSGLIAIRPYIPWLTVPTHETQKL